MAYSYSFYLDGRLLATIKAFTYEEAKFRFFSSYPDYLVRMKEVFCPGRELSTSLYVDPTQQEKF